MKITPFFYARKFGSPDHSVFLENINQEEGGDVPVLKKLGFD